ncbi:30S ribosomal protein S21, chloroplastic-like [Spinacia oleracea]|uniref:30S ribosomal protein S21, chloroplastic-like n=1 Tax=Spinacia oleracea TaxID=3562 RepID=A0A9R0K1R2_SPIOL|nr:30S ribosomal protein S21, chloroplastic-like [Spinacia oleracea]
MAATSTTSKFIALFPQTQKHKTLIPSTQKTHLSYPLSCPSISLKAPENTRNRNELFITSMGTYNVQVIVEENEHEERLLSRFRREVMRAGVIQESKRRRFFENPHDKKKRKSREAAKRNSKRRFQPRVVKQNDTETTKEVVDDFDNDNWDLPEGDLPY